VKWRPVVITLWILVVLLIFPFYMFSQKELAPAETRTSCLHHAGAGERDDRSDQEFRAAGRAVFMSTPEHRAVFQIVFPNFGFGGMVTAPFHERQRNIQQIYMDISKKASQIAGVVSSGSSAGSSVDTMTSSPGSLAAAGQRRRDERDETDAAIWRRLLGMSM